MAAPLRQAWGARLRDRWERELQSVASPAPLAVLRVGTALVLLVQAIFLAPYLTELYGSRGYVQQPIVQGWTPPGIPRLSWLTPLVEAAGWSEATGIRVVFVAYAAALAGLFLGWRTRACAGFAWLGHLMLCNSGAAGVYGVDAYARIALFYCLVAPAGGAFSLDRAAGRTSGRATFSAHLFQRMLQGHLCLTYLAAGLPKALSPQWWSGEAIWYALMQPTLAQFDCSGLAWRPGLLLAAAWGTILIEAGYPVFIWPRRTRVVWLLATLGLHLGIAVLMGLQSFGAMMIVLNLAGFGSSLSPLALRVQFAWGRRRPRGTAAFALNNEVETPPVDDSRTKGSRPSNLAGRIA